ncbi:MAG: ABC transporter ATP-binding protein [Massiliimalia sp.]
MNEIILELSHLVKSFGETPVLKDISLTVEKGEFITFLGPSGCGKTTMLRLIAGLETPDEGSIFLLGENITRKEPNHRNVNTIFQNYALFPHMNVYQNVAYGLKIKKVPKAEIKERVSKMLELVQLTGFEKRMPSELSGGQKQRVAIARALINRPAVLLLDEPLGALDLQLRRQMQTELKRLQKKLGITFIYITHDQEEALNMSDRIVVMRDGQFEQIGTPEEVYDHPLTSFAAQFVGTSNLLHGTVERIAEKEALLSFANGQTAFIFAEDGSLSPNEPVTLSVRRENMILSKTPLENSSLSAQVTETTYTGGMMRIACTLSDGTEIISTRQGLSSQIQPGEQVFIHWDHCQLVDRKDQVKA